MMCALVLLLNTSDLNRSVTEILPKSVFQYYQDRTDGLARQRSILERPEKTPSVRVQTSPTYRYQLQKCHTHLVSL